MIRGCAHEILVHKPQEKWSAQEHAGHLLDLESLWMQRVEDFLRGGTELTAADLKNRKTHEANHNARAIEKILADLRSARTQLVDRVKRSSLLCFAVRCCTRGSKNPCGSSIISTSQPNTTTIISRTFGN
jgi:hypothetical protein